MSFDIVAWTDGGCRGNPGPGGWGMILVNAASRDALERCGGEANTTNRSPPPSWCCAR